MSMPTLSTVKEHHLTTPAAEDSVPWQVNEEGLPATSKWSFVTRNVPEQAVSHAEFRIDHKPQSGDLIVASVQKIAQHTRIQLRCGRRSALYPGDQIVVAYGNRYAPDQFEAEVPTNLDSCHLVAAGGIAARARAKHSSLKWPTSIRPEGYCVDSNGEVLNLRNFALSPTLALPRSRKPVIAVLGTSMNAGKTTAAASLIKGLSNAGYKVAAIKATGTGAGNDLWAYADAGARLILDFTDAGYPSTFKLPTAAIESCFNQLLAISNGHPEIDVNVVEIADGMLHQETVDLVRSASYASSVDQTLFAAGEAMGALAGIQLLDASGIRPAALVGLLTASSLAAAEAERATGVQVLSKADLELPGTAVALLA